MRKVYIHLKNKTGLFIATSIYYSVIHLIDSNGKKSTVPVSQFDCFAGGKWERMSDARLREIMQKKVNNPTLPEIYKGYAKMIDIWNAVETYKFNQRKIIKL